jgi:hypothetical protein
MSDGIYNNVRGITRRQMVMFFLIDTSGSMEGTKISSVNTAIREVIPELRDIGGADIDLKVAIVELLVFYRSVKHCAYTKLRNALDADARPKAKAATAHKINNHEGPDIAFCKQVWL